MDGMNDDVDSESGNGNHPGHAEDREMQNKNEKLSTTDDLIRILMDIYKLSEKEAKRALNEVTGRNTMTDL